MKKIIKYIVVPAVALLLAGCGAVDLYSPVPEGKVAYTNKDNTSYIVFSRPHYGAKHIGSTIIEFDPSNYTTKPVGTLAGTTKLVYKTTPGTHYFYMDGDADDMIKITTKASTEYYVYTRVSPSMSMSGELRIHFKPYPYQSVTMLESLKGKACSADVLKEYKFKKIKNLVSELTKEMKYHAPKYNIAIECTREGVIRNVKHLNESFDYINSAKLIQPNEKAKEYYNQNVAVYLKEIKKNYPDWKKNDMANTELLPEDGKSLK